MTWIHQLGKHLLKEGALTYMVSDEVPSWDGEEEHKQKVDMIAIYPKHLSLIELKEVDARYCKRIKFKQIERYYYLRRDIKYKTEFWVYVYWHRYGVVTGALINKVESVNFYAIENKGEMNFYVSIGLDPETRIRRTVDMKMRVENEL